MFPLFPRSVTPLATFLLSFSFSLMSLPTIKTGEPPSPSGYDVEYRSIVDDAWYAVRTVLDVEKLKVKYYNCTDEQDSVFEPQNFKSPQEINDLQDRFRPVSVQLQDCECRNVAKDMDVCASHSFTDSDVRFHDAVVEDVNHTDHCFVDGEEQCMCTFVVTWTHGPNAGFMANKKIENICLVQSNKQLDPKVAIFLKIVREKLEITANKSHLPSICEDIASLPSIKPDSTFAKHFTQEIKCASRSLSNSSSSKESERIYNHAKTIKEEIDIGGINKHHVVLIDNLDKDIHPSTIVEFIHRQTSISVRAYAFPSLSSEMYTDGALVLDCEENLQKLCEFLDSPNHIVVSLRGRPWVITEKKSGNDSYTFPLGSLMPKYQNKFEHGNIGIRNDLKLVCSGSEEYKTAKRLRDLFMEFSENQQQLHKRLAVEEQKILRPSL